MKIFLIVLFSLLTLACLFMAGFEENVACAFVYILFALMGGFLCTYIAIGNIKTR